MSAALALPQSLRRDAPYALDPVLAGLAAVLLAGGLVVLASASITVAEAEHRDPFFFVSRQLVAAAIGLGAALFMMSMPTRIWYRTSFLLLVAALALLALVLIPGVGHTVNGATRWVTVAGVSVQVSEPARLLLILYLAGYIVRRQKALSTGFTGFLKPMLMLSLASGLLLAEPDFGAATVLMATALAMLFVGGARLRDFCLFFAASLGALAALAITSPYRLQRLTGFLNPWDDPWDSGFQLTQSLIAIGRGEWFGVGLGSSVQKLFYLPEAHTDFVFAVFAEELGLAGALALIALMLALVWRIFDIARRAAAAGLWFQAYAALGFGAWLGMQTFINIGVNMGLLPTKGLTLPLVSYGRSSLIVTLAGIGLMLRIHREIVAEPAAAARRRKPRRSPRKGARR